MFTFYLPHEKYNKDWWLGWFYNCQFEKLQLIIRYLVANYNIRAGCLKIVEFQFGIQSLFQIDNEIPSQYWRVIENLSRNRFFGFSIVASCSTHSN